jgi:hypothetical protein
MPAASADITAVLQMDRDEQAPIIAAPGFNPAEVGEALARRNEAARRRAAAKQTFNWVVSILVIGIAFGGAWWLSGVIVTNNPAGLSFLLGGSGALPDQQFTRPPAGTAEYDVTIDGAGGTSQSRITFAPRTSDFRVQIITAPEGQGDSEVIKVGDQIYVRPPGQTGWTVQPIASVPAGTLPVHDAGLLILTDLAPLEARDHIEVLGSSREILRGTVTRRYDLSVDQATWKAARPTSYQRWVDTMGIAPDLVVPGGLRMSVWIDESGVVWRDLVEEPGRTTTQELIAYSETPYTPPVPAQAWPIG